LCIPAEICRKSAVFGMANRPQTRMDAHLIPRTARRYPACVFGADKPPRALAPTILVGVSAHRQRVPASVRARGPLMQLANATAQVVRRGAAPLTPWMGWSSAARSAGLQSADARRSSPPSRLRLAGPSVDHRTGCRPDGVAHPPARGRRVHVGSRRARAGHARDGRGDALGVGASPPSRHGDGPGDGACGAARTDARARARALRAVPSCCARLGVRPGSAGARCVCGVRSPDPRPEGVSRTAAALRLVTGEFPGSPARGLTA
jgi:hypothetical protein